MKVEVKDSRIYGLVVLYDMHTDFFIKVLDGISNASAQSRLDTKANHINWLAGSLVQERYVLASLFTEEIQQTHHELFKEHKGIQDGVSYPPLADYKADWETISPILRKAIVNLEEKKLDEMFEMEGMEFSNFDYLSFNTYREANCIGQIALWRRLLGYEAMKYD